VRIFVAIAVWRGQTGPASMMCIGLAVAMTLSRQKLACSNSALSASVVRSCQPVTVSMTMSGH
jgi:hypothetical protein